MKFPLVVLALCAFLVKATDLDDAGCSQGSVAEYDLEGEFLGCSNPVEDAFYEEYFENEDAFECEGDAYIDSLTGTYQCCPAGQIYAWDENSEEGACVDDEGFSSPLLNDHGPQSQLESFLVDNPPANPPLKPGIPVYPSPGNPSPPSNPGNPSPPNPGNPSPPSNPLPRPGNPSPPSQPAPKPYPRFSCPAAGGTYEVVDTVIYKILCYQGFNTRSRRLKVTYTNTAWECMKACSAERMCTASNYWWNTNKCVLARGSIRLGRYSRRDKLLGGLVKGQVRN
ncbi:hypothetical protein AWENTII_010327 [Aspergillus wentii]